MTHTRARRFPLILQRANTQQRYVRLDIFNKTMSDKRSINMYMHLI